MRARGFSAVELLIAMALGLVVVATAWAGLRAVAQATASVQRLATENALVRAGWFAATAEADTWRLVDDPEDPARSRLRAWDGKRGCAFTPFPGTWDHRGTAGGEDETGFDPDDEGAVVDERAWFHGNAAEEFGSDHRFGRYELFAHQRAAVTLGGSPAYGAADPAHTWLMARLDGLRDHLGYYGAVAYGSSNALWASYGSGSHDTAPTDDGWQREWLENGSNAITKYRFTIDEGECHRPRGIYGKTNNASYPLQPACPGTALAGASDADVIAGAATYLPLGQFAGVADIDAFAKRCLAPWSLTPLKPADWPECSIAVARMIAWRRFVTSCRVRWRDPLSGDANELSFTVLSTTLRGARQQRRLSRDPRSPDYDRDLDGGRISTRCDVRRDLR